MKRFHVHVGLAWEHFQTMSEAPEFGSDTVAQTEACSVPMKSSEQDHTQAKSECYLPKFDAAAAGACCG